MTAKNTAGAVDADVQLRSFIDKFAPENQKLIRAVRAAIRKRFPTANELVWDNYNFFVIGYSPTERPTDSIVSIAAGASGVSVCFIHGASLPDPKKLLLGSGRQTRFVRVGSAKELSHPDVQALLTAATARAKVPLPPNGRGRLIIRSVAAKQRPRRKAATTMHADTVKYNRTLTSDARTICDVLAGGIDRGLPEAENRIWHGHPVWFLDGNPVVGYSKLKDGVRLLFWSGRSFGEKGLKKEGSFRAAEARYTAADQISTGDLKRWLAKARDIQWDYRNIVRRKGRLERLK